jgi:hypothetical protein
MALGLIASNPLSFSLFPSFRFQLQLGPYQVRFCYVRASEGLVAAEVVRVKLEPEPIVVQLSTVVFAVLEDVLETRLASLVRQCASVVALAVVLDFPVDAVLQERTLLNDWTGIVAGSDTLADIAFVAAGVQALVFARLVCVGVRPLGAVGPLLSGCDCGFGDFLAVAVDVVVHFLGDVAGGGIRVQARVRVPEWMVRSNH